MMSRKTWKRPAADSGGRPVKMRLDFSGGADVDFLLLTIPHLFVQVTKYMVKVGDDLRQAVSLSPPIFAGWHW